MKKIIPVITFCILVFSPLLRRGTGGEAFAQQNIAPQNLFVLSTAERALFTPPPGMDCDSAGWDLAFKKIWDAFDKGQAPVPLVESAGPKDWFELDGIGSQNHAVFYISECALGHALAGNVAKYEVAAKRCIFLLDSLDFVQGHMRHEALGNYSGYFEGGIAGMALAGLYAPAGSTSGPHLLASARKWWNEHVAVLRRIRMPDGQIGKVGGRSNFGDVGQNDDWHNIGSAVNLQILDPQPYNTLHPRIQALVTVDGLPNQNPSGPIKWSIPNHVMERWLLLRAFQSGALLRVPADQPTPLVVQNIFRWTAAGKTHIAAPKVIGYKRSRFWVSWQAGQFIRVEQSDSAGTTGGKGLPNGHNPQTPFTIPGTAVQVLGPIYSTPDPPCAATSSCGNDLAVISIVKPYHHGCMTSISPQVLVKNEGTATITNLSLYYQIDNNTLYSEYAKGGIKMKRFVIAGGLAADATMTLTLDASTVTAGTHTLKVWTMDVNKITDVNASNDLQTIQFTVVNAGKPTTYSENFESIAPGSIPSDWTLNDADANSKWFVHSNGTNKAAAFNNHAYTGANNAKDELVMPVVDLTGNSALWLSFDLCHASKPNSTKFDSLQVMISTDCGQTFTSIWGRGGTALNTVPDNANLFIPSGPQDYQNVKVDLSAYNTSSKAIFKFINWSNNGNSTLIDNVNFTNSAVTGVSGNDANSLLNVFPNPASGSVRVSYQLQSNAELKIKILNSMGQTVSEVNAGIKQAGPYVSEIDLGNYPAGIYNLMMVSGNQVTTKKIVVLK